MSTNCTKRTASTVLPRLYSIIRKNSYIYPSNRRIFMANIQVFAASLHGFVGYHKAFPNIPTIIVDSYY